MLVLIFEWDYGFRIIQNKRYLTRMEKQMDTEDIHETAAQLRCPSGQKGLEMAALMDRTNINMTVSGINSLRLSANDRILELGHGNCGHLNKILSQLDTIRYCGLEISPVMRREAERLNAENIGNVRASFHLYDGKNIPFEDGSFDKLLTVNTIYFWEKASSFLKEMHRVLKPEGRCGIVFVQKSFMEKLPFCEYGFNLFDNSDVISLIKRSPFKLIKIKNKKEMVKEENERYRERAYSLTVLEK